MLQSGPALTIDVVRCDREPIHIPGSVQPHGYLLAVEPRGMVLRVASTNVSALLGQDVERVVGDPLATLFGREFADSLAARASDASLDHRAVYLQKLKLGVDGSDRLFNVIGHRRDGLLVLELEPGRVESDGSFNNLHPLVESFLSRLGTSSSIRELAELAAEEIRRITGFDRVLTYQFNAEWNGTVIAESRNERLPSYNDLRFPASDIPRQARELYRTNRLRIIPDVGYTPAPLTPATNPLTGRPLDLSFSVLRSVSPVHVEYMKNMGMAASMSISIIRDGRLWGLISCHHKDPVEVPFDVRMACDFLGQVFSLQLSAKENHAQSEYRVELKTVLSHLLGSMTREENFIIGLLGASDELLRLTGAQGAAVVLEDQCHSVGITPTEAQIKALVSWIAERERRDVFSTDSLPVDYPAAAEFKDVASGLLGIAISKVHKSFILWFRPEVVQTVKWGGDPRKAAEADEANVRLHPRKSFDLWKETVRDRALEWQVPEIEIATEFRNVIIGIVLKKAEELAGLTRDLERSNKELEAFSYSVSHDLRAPFRHIVGYGQLLQDRKTAQLDAEARRYVNVMIDSAQYAGKLVDNLLSFSQMGRATLSIGKVDMNALFAEVKRDVISEAGNRSITWKITPAAPPALADLMMLKLAVRNLLSNAIKYTGPRDMAVIEIGAEVHDQEVVYFVRDNGVGFDMAYENKLFGVFQRLHAVEEFEGTGIGLANVRRIISRHGGRTWAEGAVDQGATFYFSLPKVAAINGGGRSSQGV